jgi:hypothetical protein
MLEAELLLEPGRMPPNHRHPSQDERFHVIAGVLQVKINGTLINVGPGEDVDIPRGTSHSMGVVGVIPVRAIWLTRPALRTAHWWAALDAASRRSANRRIPLPVMARALRAHRREFQLALPRFVAGPLLPILSLLPPWRYAAQSDVGLEPAIATAGVSATPRPARGPR